MALMPPTIMPAISPAPSLLLLEEGALEEDGGGFNEGGEEGLDVVGGEDSPVANEVR